MIRFFKKGTEFTNKPGNLILYMAPVTTKDYNVVF